MRRRVVGCDGVLTAAYPTPAWLAPLVVNETNHLVRAMGVTDVAIPDEGPLPGEGTRLGPWPADGSEVLYALARSALRDLAPAVAAEPALGPTVRQWVAASLDAPTEPPAEGAPLAFALAPTVRGAYAHDLAVLLAPRAELDAFGLRVARYARERVEDAMRDGAIAPLQHASWFLFRAARTQDDRHLVLGAWRMLGMTEARIATLLAVDPLG